MIDINNTVSTKVYLSHLEMYKGPLTETLPFLRMLKDSSILDQADADYLENLIDRVEKLV